MIAYAQSLERGAFCLMITTLGAGLAILSLVNGLVMTDPSPVRLKIEDLKSNTLQAVVTAYSSTPEETDDTPFITANGTTVRDGIVAANFLEFGTKIKIPEHFGDKVFEVQDRMHHRFGERVDIWFASKEEATRFGKRNLTIELL